LAVAEHTATKVPGIGKVVTSIKELKEATNVSDKILQTLTRVTGKLERVGDLSQEAKSMGPKGARLTRILENLLDKSKTKLEDAKKCWFASSVLGKLEQIEKDMEEDLRAYDRLLNTVMCKAHLQQN